MTCIFVRVFAASENFSALETATHVFCETRNLMECFVLPCALFRHQNRTWRAVYLLVTPPQVPVAAGHQLTADLSAHWQSSSALERGIQNCFSAIARSRLPHNNTALLAVAQVVRLVTCMRAAVERFAA